MSTEGFLQVAISTSMTVFLAVAGWWARKHPNRSKEYPERIRMPKMVPLIGWLLIGTGVLIGMVGWFTPERPLDARIASAAVFLAGWMFVGMYRNFYVAPRQYEVAFRSILGKEHVIPYCDIDTYHLGRVRRQPILTIRSIHGAKLSLNLNGFVMGPLLRAIDYHRATGRWPVPAEPVPADTVEAPPGR
ncbi:hypothetical protein ACFFON_06265 [Arthrobacter citreus]|uniref:hypothetical protein n=1 Tax=Arthrobacter TaxID=1663 RepID=UPI001FEC98E6|nr:hypothetical protein [Arthrobacter gandavensis]